MIGIYFGIRGGREHRKLSLRNFAFDQDTDGNKYILYTERTTKSNQGGIKHRKVEKHSARAYANVENVGRCPVTIIEKYIKLCPQGTLKDCFYLKPLNKPKPDVWFSKVPLGHNVLSGIVKEMST